MLNEQERAVAILTQMKQKIIEWIRIMMALRVTVTNEQWQEFHREIKGTDIIPGILQIFKERQLFKVQKLKHMIDAGCELFGMNTFETNSLYVVARENPKPTIQAWLVYFEGRPSHFEARFPGLHLSYLPQINADHTEADIEVVRDLITHARQSYPMLPKNIDGYNIERLAPGADPLSVTIHIG